MLKQLEGNNLNMSIFEAKGHIPRAKSVLAMVAKAGAVQLGAHSKRNYLRSLDEEK